MNAKLVRTDLPFTRRSRAGLPALSRGSLGGSTRILFAFLCFLLVAACQADRARTHGVLLQGTPWETGFVEVETGVPGPVVLVTGGVHGDEPAGSRAADQIQHWPIMKGRMIVIPRVNVPGLKAAQRTMPGELKGQTDLNRNFPGADPGTQPRGTLATALWDQVSQWRPDWVLDLHEGMDFHVSHKPGPGKKRSVGSSVIFFKGGNRDVWVKRALEAVNQTVTDPDRRFVPLTGGPVAGSLARACSERLGAQAMILETTYRDQPLSLRVRQHRILVNSLFYSMGLLDQDASLILAPSEEGRPLQVGLFDGGGTGLGGKRDMTTILDGANDMEVRYLGPPDLRPEILGQLDAVVFPGGSGSRQAESMGDAGRQAVKGFVEQGGGYLGICAGAYLGSSHYSWSLGLLDAAVFTGAREIPGKGRKQMWYRGAPAQVRMELASPGRSLFPDIPESFEVRYHNGPILSPGHVEGLEDYEVLAWFRSENVLYEPQRGTMVNTPAIVRGRLGPGRVIAISPHPETEKALHPLLLESLRWIAKPRQ